MRQYYAPDFEVKIQGLTMEADVKSAVINLSYDNNLEQADMVHLTLNNADMRLTDSALFDVGKTVEIHLGYAGNLKPVMLGEIVSVQPSFPEGGAPTISITGYDKSHRMRHNLKTRSFQYSSASLIAAQIAAENLLIPVVDPSPVPFENKTQNCSDMAMLKDLARRNFFETYVHWDKLYFRFPRPQTEAVYLEWGKNLSSFSPRLSTSGQVGLLSIQDYDQKLAQTIVGLVPVIAADTNFDNIVERLGSGFVNSLADLGTRCVSGESLNSFPDAASFAKSILEEILEGLFEGSGSCIGIPELRAGDMVDIGGVGKRFSGKYRLRTVNHTINGSGYRTTFEVTQRSSGTVLQLFRKIFEDTPSPHKQKKMSAPAVGTVTNNVDTEGLGRVQVKYPWLNGSVQSSWAKVVQPDIGVYFMPDVGDDVCVSFDKGDFDRPIVTGTFWNVDKTPPETAAATNYKKVIRSREGHKIVLDDTPKQGGILLQSSDKAKAFLSLSAEGGIILQSSGGAKIVLSETGDITIEAKDPQGNVTIKSGSTGKIDLNPT